MVGEDFTPASTTRRRFMGFVAVGAMGYVAFRDGAVSLACAAGKDASSDSAGALAGDESFWSHIQQAFAVDRSVINLNNGGVNPSPRMTQDALRRHLEFSNQIPSRNLWHVLDPQIELVRQRLARQFGCDAEELAITRNTSESLEIALYGLDLEPGDEILTTDQDYPRMINTLKQREQRDGIKLVTFDIPNPPGSLAELTRAFESRVTSRTRALLVSHMTTYTGQVFPVADVCRMARAKGITTIVDGAHAFGQIVYDGGAVGADFYGTSLHKWLHAPIGTGFLYVRRDRIERHWPLMAAPDPRANDIRKFEEIGTHPSAPRLAIAEALVFQEGIGPKRKEARLRFLRDRFAKRLTQNDRVRFFTSLKPEQSCAIATIGFEGIGTAALQSHLWKKHKIYTIAIRYGKIDGLRISPNVYTTLGEIDFFCDVVEGVIRNGLPKSV